MSFSRKLELRIHDNVDQWPFLEKGELQNAIDIDLYRVAHHRFEDTHGSRSGGNPYVKALNRFVSDRSTDYLNFIDGGIGFHKEARTSRMNLLGRAFCRTVLEEHFDVWRFWHLEHAIDSIRGWSNLSPTFRDFELKRASEGNAPDYIAARGWDEPILVEAKGHRSAHGIGTKAWKRWRRQFETVHGFERNQMVSIDKGFLVASRLLEESQSTNRKRSNVRIEDPSSPGEEASAEFELFLANLATVGHYASVFSCLGQEHLAHRLRAGKSDGELIGEQLQLFECQAEGYKGERFVGKHYPRFGHRPSTVSPANVRNAIVEIRGMNMAFFGLHERQLRRVKPMIRHGIEGATEIVEPFEREESDADDFSILKDGTVLGNPRYFRETGESAEV